MKTERCSGCDYQAAVSPKRERAAVHTRGYAGVEDVREHAEVLTRSSWELRCRSTSPRYIESWLLGALQMRSSD